MTDPPIAPGEVLIELFESEHIVERGTRSVKWFVRCGDAWLRAQRAPGARTELLSAKPGTLWEMRIELRSMIGGRVLRVESAPHARPVRDAFAHLMRGASGGATRIVRNEYRVAARGALEPSVAPSTPKRTSENYKTFESKKTSRK
jgi:hypothetical protein